MARKWHILWFAVVLTGVLTSAYAQEMVKGVSFDAKETPVQEVLAKIGKDIGAAVVADSTVSGNVTAKVESQPVEKALDLVCKITGDGLSWRRLFVPKNQPINPDKLAETMRALKVLEVAGIFIEDPVTKQGTSLLKNFPLQPGYDAQMRGEASGFKEVFLVTNEKAAQAAKAKTDPNKDPDQQMSRVQKYNQMAQEQLNMFMQMTPEERMQAMQSGMQMFMNMDPQARQQLMQMGMQMGMEMWQQMDPQTRQQMLEQSMQMFQQMFQNNQNK